jgi:hypothetical protein
MTFEISTITLPAHWASALVNGDESSFDRADPYDAADLAAMDEVASDLASEGWCVDDVARDADGEPVEPRFTWMGGLYGGVAPGIHVLKYTIVRLA